MRLPHVVSHNQHLLIMLVDGLAAAVISSFFKLGTAKPAGFHRREAGQCRHLLFGKA